MAAAPSSRPKLDEYAKKILQRERRSLQRRSASDAEQRLETARSQMRYAQDRIHNVNRATNENAFLRSVHALVTAVESSFGLNVPIHIGATIWGSIGEVQASTDFQSIRIVYPRHLIPASDLGFDAAVLTNTIADIKGISYHEIGHNLFTVPFPDLVALAAEEGFIFPSDRGSSEFQWTWNVLEDQRMEAAVVRESPVMVDYFTTMVLTHILQSNGERARQYIKANQWALIAGRRYLPRAVRTGVRERFVEAFDADTADHVSFLIHKYASSTSAAEMLRTVVEFKDLFMSLDLDIPANTDQHTYSGAGTNGVSQSDSQQRIQKSASQPSQDDDEQSESQSTFAPGNSDESDEDESTETGDSAGDDQDGDDGESTDGTSEDGDDGSPQSDLPSDKPGRDRGRSDVQDTPPPSSVPGTGASSTGNTDSLEDSVAQALDDANSRRLSDSSLQSAVRSVYETVGSDQVPLTRHFTPHQMSNETLASTAVALASTLEQALNVYMAETAPLWQQRQSRGVIDPFAYRTRTSGSLDYRRSYEDGDVGVDMAVTLALDISGSMHGWDDHLGAAAFATKSACDALGIPCSVVEFNHNARLLWLPSDPPSLVSLRCDGGTNPTEAMDSLEYLSYDKRFHLIVVMTDGEFVKEFQGFNYYRTDERFFLGLAFGNSSLQYALERQGADEAYAIGDLMQIPEIVSNFIVSRMR